MYEDPQKREKHTGFRIEVQNEVLVMGAVIIACNTIKDEVNKVIEEERIDYPVIWIESGLHKFP